MTFVLSFFLCILEMGIVVIFCSAFLNRTKTNRMWLAGFFLLAAVSCLCANLPVIKTIPWKQLSGILALTVFLQIFYNGKFLTKLLCAVFGFSILAGVEAVVSFLLSAIFRIPLAEMIAGVDSFLFMMLLIYMTAFALVYWIWRIRRSQQAMEKLSAASGTAMVLFPAISLFTLLLLQQIVLHNQPKSIVIILDAIGLVVANAALFYILVRVEKDEKAKAENVILQQQLSEQMETAQALLDAHREQRKRTHDFRHHMDVLNGLLRQNQTEKAQQYISELYHEDQLNQQMLNTGNPFIDVILNRKYAVAIKDHISMNFVLDDLSDFPLTHEETVVVLSNLLDNAIEACRNTDGERHIEVKLTHAGMGMLLSIGNSVSHDFVPGEIPGTTKTDPMLHGYGLHNVFTILSRYKCTPAIVCKDGWFLFSALIFENSLHKSAILLQNP